MVAGCSSVCAPASASDGVASPRDPTGLRFRRGEAANDVAAEGVLGAISGTSVGYAEASPLPFTPLELLVIEIGARDRATLVKSRSRLARLMRLLFGIEAPAPFADARLEALRVLANAGRHSGQRAERAITAARDAGFTADQIEQLISNVRGDAR